MIQRRFVLSSLLVGALAPSAVSAAPAEKPVETITLLPQMLMSKIIEIPGELSEVTNTKSGETWTSSDKQCRITFGKKNDGNVTLSRVEQSCRLLFGRGPFEDNFTRDFGGTKTYKFVLSKKGGGKLTINKAAKTATLEGVDGATALYFSLSRKEKPEWTKAVVPISEKTQEQLASANSNELLVYAVTPKGTFLVEINDSGDDSSDPPAPTGSCASVDYCSDEATICLCHDGSGFTTHKAPYDGVTQKGKGQVVYLQHPPGTRFTVRQNGSPAIVEAEIDGSPPQEEAENEAAAASEEARDEEPPTHVVSIYRFASRDDEVVSVVATNTTKKEVEDDKITVELVQRAGFAGAFRLGVAIIGAGALDHSYSAVTSPGGTGKEIRREQHGVIAPELVVTFSAFPELFRYGRFYSGNRWRLRRAKRKSRKRKVPEGSAEEAAEISYYASKPRYFSRDNMRFNPLIGVGLVGPGNDGAELLKSFYFGMEFDFHRYFAISGGLVVRRVARLAEGYQVGGPVELDTGPTRDGYAPSWFFMVSFTPDVFKVRKKLKGAIQ